MEEKFEDLLNEYWDEKLVNDKLNDDEIAEVDEEKNPKVNSRTDSPFTFADEIYIDDFVNRYLDIKGDFSNLRHFELKNLNCPYVIGVANSYADTNPAFVREKKYLLIVIDRNGNRGTYINPVIAHEFFDYDYKEAKKKLNRGTSDLKNLEQFMDEFMHVKAEYEAYQEFFHILRENKKITKFKKIENYENQLGDDKDDKHKRR